MHALATRPVCVRAPKPTGGSWILASRFIKPDPVAVMALFDHRRVFLSSLRPIAKGEELLLDYHVRGDIDPIPCRCGAAQCRGFLNDPEPA